jgi:MOSC domain-containing protein YiiM
MGQVEELRIVSVNVAQPAVLLPRPDGDVISGIDKKPVETPVLGLTRLNLAGDGQADTRTAIRQEGMVGWYLRVLTPGEVPVHGPLTVADRHPAGVTVAQVHAALQRRNQVFPEPAALDVMSANLRGQLSRRGRDLTNGVPEQD